MKNQHTSGTWIVGIDNNVYSQDGDVKIALVKTDFNVTLQQAEANAKLIADAGTTANKCGLVPSEILQQRDELLKALELYMERLKNGWMINLAWREDTHEIMEQAIKKAKGD